MLSFIDKPVRSRVGTVKQLLILGACLLPLLVSVSCSTAGFKSSQQELQNLTVAAASNLTERSRKSARGSPVRPASTWSSVSGPLRI